MRKKMEFENEIVVIGNGHYILVPKARMDICGIKKGDRVKVRIEKVQEQKIEE